MFDKMDMALLNVQARGKRVIERLIHEEDGATNFIEIGVIVVIVVGVAVVFKRELGTVVAEAFKKVTDFMKDTN
ncbi:hypothetical protein GPL15_07870 [Clostridium sp. MCC353]|uniref:Flp1 family type IVb pilin n=1 Tax=Clostridium sp. MCC353 TaxID=2592646 RepID=UPI001C0169B9|nr:Flp1 family type IVb pilin [Clostridium sp. MCC353]MBT9776419.1 hypothetical protein [Clostridium sp. MCC353]